MKIGIVETIEDAPEKKARRRGGLSGGNGPGSGSGGRGPGGGGSSRNEDQDDIYDPTAPNPAKSKMLTYFLLLVVLMTFGGVIAAYVVIATNGSLEWNPFDLPLQVWISTAIIALSSVAYHFGERAMQEDRHLQAKRWLIAATFLGATFISSQLIVWLELAKRGVYAYGNPYAGFFYILTALHAVHVFGGIIALSSVLLRAWNLPRNDRDVERRKTLSQVVGWYWHMMGVLWLVLLGLLGFWK